MAGLGFQCASLRQHPVHRLPVEGQSGRQHHGLGPIGFLPRILVFQVKSERKHVVRKVIRAPLRMKRPQCALGRISGISRERWCLKLVWKAPMWLLPPFVTSYHPATVYPRLSNCARLPWLLQETFSLFSTVPPWEYGTVLLRIMNLFSHHCLWWGMNLKRCCYFIFPGES